MGFARIGHARTNLLSIFVRLGGPGREWKSRARSVARNALYVPPITWARSESRRMQRAHASVIGRPESTRVSCFDFIIRKG